MQRQQLRQIARVFPLVAIVLLLIAGASWARSGSGENYNSGRSSSSGSGDDDGLIDIAFLLIRLCIEYPAIGIPITIVVVIYFLYSRATAGNTSTRKALDAAAADQKTQVSAGAINGWVNALKLQDPQFDLIQFLDFTKQLFVKVQTAWLHQNLEPVRRHLSDATWQRLSVQLRILEAQGVRDAMADLKVIDLQMISLNQTPSFDSVQVKITATARDSEVPAGASFEEATAAAQRVGPEKFTEVWSLVRRPGAHTNPQLGDNKCPNCGAAFNGGASNQCEFCKAIVNSGLHDWVLTEVTQASEYDDRSPVAGLLNIRARDPEVSTEALEDRASLIFWKWVEAQVLRQPTALLKVATPAFAERVNNEVKALATQGKRKVMLDCAVGAVNTHSFQGLDGDDAVAIELRWSARMGIATDTARPAALPSIPNRWVLVLRRSATATTPAGHGVSTNRCPNCSAPLTDNGTVNCEFCGTALASGERDWVLESMTQWESWNGVTQRIPVSAKAAKRVDAITDPQERERLLYMMAAMAMADGAVDQKERALLNTCAKRWSIDQAKIDMVFSAGPEVFDKLLVKHSQDAQNFMRELVLLALVDGKIDRNERRMLQAAAEHLGVEALLPNLMRELKA